MECYLDNSATTAADAEVAELMMKIMTEDYGNPASLHRKGFEAEKYIRDARDIFAGLLKCRESEIYFTSGGTESDNLALIGGYMANRRRGNHVITTAVEHPAVSRAAEYLEKEGARVDYLEVDREGHVDPARLESLLDDDTVIVSVMHVNNEIGAIEPIEEIGDLIHRKQPECLFHVDDIQGFGKLKTDLKKCHIDMLSASSHKIHGPKGTGLFYKSERAKVIPMIYGGGHQKGLRSGTENVPGVAGFALAAQKMYTGMEDHFQRVRELSDMFRNGVQEIDDIKLNGGDMPCIISLSVKDVRAEVLLHALEDRGIYVSAGSACSSNKPSVSATLKAIGVEPWQLESTVRVSLSHRNTEEEIRYTLDVLKETIPGLRRFVRR